ncbi:MAG: TIGR04438 family Trp-rich protein [Burkholderiales bacterium]|nr:TIGR04438 family Trp-rich protein [Burkholderiales bacterium]
MAFLILGLALLAMKVAAFGPVAVWSWWAVLAPFGLAAAWWAFADATGLTKRRAADKFEQRKAERRKRDMEALGLGVKPGRRDGGAPARDSRHDLRASADEQR